MGRDSDQDDAGLMEGEEPGKAGGDEEFLADPERDDEPPSPEAELLNDVTQHYLNEIGAKPLFTPDEEYFWASRARAGRGRGLRLGRAERAGCDQAKPWRRAGRERGGIVA